MAGQGRHDEQGDRGERARAQARANIDEAKRRLSTEGAALRERLGQVRGRLEEKLGQVREQLEEKLGRRT